MNSAARPEDYGTFVRRFDQAVRSSVDFEFERVARAVPVGTVAAQTFRAVRSDGVELVREIMPNQYADGFSGYLIEESMWLLRGDYEWQHLVGDEWITLSRYWVPPRADR